MSSSLYRNCHLPWDRSFGDVSRRTPLYHRQTCLPRHTAPVKALCNPSPKLACPSKTHDRPATSQTRKPANPSCSCVELVPVLCKLRRVEGGRREKVWVPACTLYTCTIWHPAVTSLCPCLARVAPPPRPKIPAMSPVRLLVSRLRACKFGLRQSRFALESPVTIRDSGKISYSFGPARLVAGSTSNSSPPLGVSPVCPTKL